MQIRISAANVVPAEHCTYLLATASSGVLYTYFGFAPRPLGFGGHLAAPSARHKVNYQNAQYPEYRQDHSCKSRLLFCTKLSAGNQ